VVASQQRRLTQPGPFDFAGGRLVGRGRNQFSPGRQARKKQSYRVVNPGEENALAAFAPFGVYDRIVATARMSWRAERSNLRAER
jgi:hypothetical protein